MARTKQQKTVTAQFAQGISIAQDFNSNEDFRFEKPVWDKDKCIKCGVCYLFCPDGAIRPDREGYYEADLAYCKGCGLCSMQCWTRCITMEESSKRFPWLIKL